MGRSSSEYTEDIRGVKKMEKKIVFLDMDGVLADFERSCTSGETEVHFGEDTPIEMLQEHFFTNLRVMDGAKSAVQVLLEQEHLDVYIGSKCTTKKNKYGWYFHCASEKFRWINMHFPKLIKKVMLACDKGLLNGDYLIDDSLEWKDKFPGEFIHFDGSNIMQSWDNAFKIMGVNYGTL